MTIEVRPIRPGEGPALVKMIHALAESHGFLHKQRATAANLERALFAETPIVGCLIAFLDGAPAGCAFWHRSFATSRGEEVIYLEDLAVLPQYRRRGVARALLREMAKLAKARGCPSIFWIVMEWNEGARALYEKAGAELEEGVVFCRLADKALTALAESKA